MVTVWTVYSSQERTGYNPKQHRIYLTYPLGKEYSLLQVVIRVESVSQILTYMPQ